MSDIPAMRVFLTEITERDTDLDFTQDEKWVAEAVARVDERFEDGPQAPKQPSQRSIRTHLNLRKVDEVVVVTGDIETSIQRLCSRCATPFDLPAHPTFSALFCRDPEMAGIAHLAREAKGKGEERHEIWRPRGQNRGFQRHAHDASLDASYGPGAQKSNSGEQDIDITYLSEDFIDLGDILSEQLQLRVPFQPLCKESCKGICANCGADLNIGRCACDKILKTTPFSVLQNIKTRYPSS